IADAVEALGAQVGAHLAERRHVRVAEALDKVLLDAASRRHNGRNMVVLDQVAQNAAETGRDQVGGVAQEDGRLVPRLGVSPCALNSVSVDWAVPGCPAPLANTKARST